MRSYFGAAVVALVVLWGRAEAAPPKEPIDRVVGVVGDTPIFLSELRERARPFLVRIDAESPPKEEASKAAAKAALYKELLERMIDERLEARESDRAHLRVEEAEIDAAIKMLSEQARMKPADVLAEAKRQGLSEQDYRDEIKRQVLEGKLIQLRLRSRVKVTEGTARATYASWVKEQTGPNAPIDLRILVLTVGADDRKAQETLANQIVKEAKAPGADFCALVKKHSQDKTTSTTCGSRGPMARTLLYPAIAKTAEGLKPGETAAPFPLEDPSGSEVLIVMQRTPGSDKIPTFESVREKMVERATIEAVERERRLWLEGLRKNAHVEVML